MPTPGPGVCRVCCGPGPADHAHCFACRLVARRLGAPLAPVVPVRLCPLPGPLYTVLLGYKESPVAEARGALRRHRPRSCSTASCSTTPPASPRSAGGPFDLVLPVPSPTAPGRLPSPPSSGLGRLRHRADGRALVRRTCSRGAAAAPVGHMRPDPGASPSPPRRARAVPGARVLLLDDTYVSGARAQSAAAALRRAGARSA